MSKIRQHNFEKAGKGLFSKALKRAGIEGQISASRSISVATEVLSERFGEGFDVHVRPKYIAARTLTIEVAHPAISEEIQSQSEAIISEINERLGRPEVVQMQYILEQPKQEY